MLIKVFSWKANAGAIGNVVDGDGDDGDDGDSGSGGGGSSNSSWCGNGNNGKINLWFTMLFASVCLSLSRPLVPLVTQPFFLTSERC